MNVDRQLGELYRQRFDERQLPQRNRIWRTLCTSFFQRYIPTDSAVLDVAGGFCEFINNTDCGQKHVIDLNDQLSEFAGQDVNSYNCSCTDMSIFATNSMDVVFMSNLLEHLATRQDILQTLCEALRVLKPKGRLLILQPNIRYLSKTYWDFFDHQTALSHKGLVEGLQLAGFSIERVIPRFLPYTTKSNIPQKPFLVNLYLKLPLIWRILGKQMFIVARKPCPTH